MKTHRPKQFRKQHTKQRGTTAQRGYGYRWRKYRLVFLAANPLCNHCKRKAATQVDHIKAVKDADDPLFWEAQITVVCARDAIQEKPSEKMVGLDTGESLMIRERKCVGCSAGFCYPVGKGRDRMYCSEDCRQVIKQAERKRVMRSYPKCSVDGCLQSTRSKKSSLCDSCYSRKRRTGKVEKIRHRGWYQTKAGYVLSYSQKDHPLAINGKVFQHRMLLYDLIGPGEHPCYWCGMLLLWGQITVDHLNEIKHDNRHENLVVSCNKCNRLRGALMPFIRSLSEDGLQRLSSLIKTIRVDGGFGR